jgi:hypothetical protein
MGGRAFALQQELTRIPPTLTELASMARSGSGEARVAGRLGRPAFAGLIALSAVATVVDTLVHAACES